MQKILRYACGVVLFTINDSQLPKMRKSIPDM